MFLKVGTIFQSRYNKRNVAKQQKLEDKPEAKKTEANGAHVASAPNNAPTSFNRNAWTSPRKSGRFTSNRVADIQVNMHSVYMYMHMTLWTLYIKL